MQYRNFRIDYVEDCGPNEGGYYCQVYHEADEKQVDDFCIHAEEIVGDADPEMLIKQHIDNMYDVYIRDGDIDPQRNLDLTL